MTQGVDGEAGLGLHRRRIGHASGPGAGLPIARNRDVDYARVARGDRLVVEAEGAQRSRAEGPAALAAAESFVEPGPRPFRSPRKILDILGREVSQAKAHARSFREQAGAPAKAADFAWADVVMVSGMHIQAPQMHDIAARAKANGKVVSFRRSHFGTVACQPVWRIP